jgi:hypothetical protein
MKITFVAGLAALRLRIAKRASPVLLHSLHLCITFAGTIRATLLPSHTNGHTGPFSA